MALLFLEDYLREQIVRASARSHSYVYDDQQQRRPKRQVYFQIKSYLDQFMDQDRSIRWVSLSGLRGTGKTTLLSQLYDELPLEPQHKLFISVDDLVQVVGASLSELIVAYEALLGEPLESLSQPVLFFLDEVHFDPQWAIFLKTLYDRSRHVFIVATGSSALALQMSPDSARRNVLEPVYPLSFCEYLQMKADLPDVSELSQVLRDVIFQPELWQQIPDALKAVQKLLKSTLSSFSTLEIDRYLERGTLPFMLDITKDEVAFRQLESMLDRVIKTDIPQLSTLSTESLSRIPSLLYALADSDQTSLHTLASSFQISRPTLVSILETLEHTKVLYKVLPYGSHAAQVKKPAKYLFCAPSLRAMYYQRIGSIKSREVVLGKLLEDTVGMFLMRLFEGHPAFSLSYDSAAGGADFIVKLGEQILIIEVGHGQKGIKQVLHTQKRVKATGSIIISKSALAFDPEHQILKLPIEYFLLI